MKLFTFIFCFVLTFSSHVFANTPGEIIEGKTLRDVPMNALTPNKLTHSNKTIQFSAYRGKPFIINLWASWCGPCREEMGSLERLSQRFGGKQFNIIGISTDDDADAAAEAVKEAKLSFANYLDHDVILENMLGANTIPLTILVDANGRVLKKVRGSQAWDDAASLKLIEQTFHITLTSAKLGKKAVEKK